jgi:hypothetical protein
MAHLVLYDKEEAFTLGDTVYCVEHHPRKVHCMLSRHSPNPSGLPSRVLRHEIIHIFQFRQVGSTLAFLSNYFAYSFSLYIVSGFDAGYSYYNNPVENEGCKISESDLQGKHTTKKETFIWK